MLSIGKFVDIHKSRALVFALMLASFAVRLLPIRQELPPYSFCDEDIYADEARRLITSDSWVTSEFRAGGMNIYPTVIVGKLLQYLGKDITLSTSIITGRFLGPVLLGSLTTILVYLIAFEISKNRSVALLAGIFFILSPAVYAYGRISYPDHFIYFFSAGFLYYLLKAIRNSSTFADFAILGIFLGTSASVKYTGIFLLVPFAVVVLAEIYRNRLDSAKVARSIIRFTATAIASACTFLLINFSALVEPRAFMAGLRYNIENYENFQGSTLTGAGYYLFVSYIMLFGILGSLAVVVGYAKLCRKGPLFLFVIASFPIFLSSLLALGGLVLNRNMSITIPFVIPVMALGAYSMFHTLRAKLGNNAAIFCALIFFAQPSYAFGTSALHDLKQDSRLLASPWIKENIPNGTVIGVGGTCSNMSPAQTAGFQTEIDAFLDQKKEYYVFVSYWGSPFDDFYRKNVGIFQVVDQKYLHFYHFNDRKIFRLPKEKLSLNDLTPTGYEIIKVISSNGPDVIILERID
jgi:4-amino-4-deoxy-L-arabinose transferase-like glycosyltransferase